MRGLITAFRTLTVIPLPGKDAERFSSSLYAFPLVGALIGLMIWPVAWAVGVLLKWPAGAGMACIALSAAVTGGLHLDGLADVFDSMGAHTREKKLEIMKDPRIGTFGVIALVCVLLAQFVAVSRLAEHGRFLWLVLPYIVSRTCQVPLMVWLPYARKEGTARLFVEDSKPAHFLLALVLGGALCFAFGRIGGLLCLTGGLVVAGILMVWMRKVYGGVTGDLIGMTSETVETLALVGLAMAV